MQGASVLGLVELTVSLEGGIDEGLGCGHVRVAACRCGFPQRGDDLYCHVLTWFSSGHAGVKLRGSRCRGRGGRG